MANYSVKFADGSNQYTFGFIQTFRDTFADAVTATVRMPGMDGGFDHYGSEPAPAAIGQVNMTFDLVAEDKDDMQAQVDAVSKLYYLGKQKLYWQPQGSHNERWCYARIGNISIPKRPADTTDWVQRVTISFNVSDPHWYEDEDNTAISASGTSTQDTVTNPGNAVALARVVIVPGSGNSIANPVIKRMVSGSPVETLSYIGTLNNTDELIISAQDKSCYLNSTGSYSNLTFDHPDWLRLLPGDNTIQVEADNAGDAATVTVYFYPTYR